MEPEEQELLEAAFFLLEETAVVREALEDWENDWTPWGPFRDLEAFRSAWVTLTADPGIHRKLGFYVFWDSVRNCLPERFNQLVQDFPPEIGDYSSMVMRSILRADNFDGFTEALTLFFASLDDGLEEELEEATPQLFVWWSAQRERVLQDIYEMLADGKFFVP